MQIPGWDDDRLIALRDRLRVVPWAAGVLSGAATCFGSYVVFFVLVAASGTVQFRHGVGAVLRSVGLRFYNAQNVPTLEQQRQAFRSDGEVIGELTVRVWNNTISGHQRIHQYVVADGEVVRDSTQTTVIATDPTLPQFVYFLVPVVVLLVAAALFTHSVVQSERFDGPTDVIVVAVGVAAAVSLGYLVVVLLGTYALAVQGSTAGVFIRPARLEALGYGLAYPFITTAVAAGFVLGLTTEA